MKLVLDTNAYSDFAEGRPEIVDLMVQHADSLFLPAVVIGELMYGFRKGKRQKRNDEMLARFIREFDVTVLPVDIDVAGHYAALYLALSSRGTPIPINDVWIAACCRSIGGTLLTRDRHFETVPEIEKILVS